MNGWMDGFLSYPFCGTNQFVRFVSVFYASTWKTWLKTVYNHHYIHYLSSLSWFFQAIQCKEGLAVLILLHTITLR